MTEHLKKILISEPFTKTPFDNEGWGRFFHEVFIEGLAPAFYLHTIQYSKVPEAIRKEAKKAYENALLFKDYAVCRLKELRPAILASGRVVIIKGLSLCEKIYREPSARPMGDVDLYFPDGTLEKARNVFLENGFTRLNNYNNVLCFKGLHVDLHNDLWGTGRIGNRSRCIPDVEEFFEPSGLVPGFLIPSPPLLAAHSAFHCIKHCFSRKVWYLDLLRMYKEGYFETLLSRRIGPLPGIVLDYLRSEGLIHESFPRNKIPAFQRRTLFKLFSMKERPGAGECALAFTMPKFGDSMAYMAESLVPRKEILREMYGNHPYFLLILHRIFTIISYTFGMLTWNKNK